ncbi:MAG: hypothetical protein NDI69_16065 [Bacteriovoracaceae bacterium]|nr:hypothetical protein [Bacteriovoracaceae bacterium]
MKEFIQNTGNDVSIVIYDAPLPPKYFRLSKRFIRTLFVTVPLLVIVLLTGFFLWGLGNRLKDAPAPTIPEVITESDSKLTALESEIKALQDSNKELVEKLSVAPAVAMAEDPYLMAIKKPYGMQNFLAQNKITLDQLALVQNENKVNLKFQLISSSPESKVTGHILVFMLSNSGLMAYPKEANNSLGQGIKYSMGEPFSFSRLRPTNAEFLLLPTGDSAKFIIYIFNREGDLLLIKETESFKLGPPK